MMSDKSMLSSSAAFRLLAAGCAVAAAAGTAHAQDISASVDLSAAGGYASNPFLEDPATASTGSGFVEGSIRPNVAVTDARGRTDFAAYYRRTEYFRRYSAANSYGISARGQRQLNERIEVRALLAYDSSIVGAADPDGDLIDPGIPESPDVGLIGSRQRRNSFNSSVGATWRPNARDSWNVDFDATKTDYPNGGLATDDYVSYGGRIGYSRALSETSSIGGTFGYTEVDYDGIGRDSSILTPQVTYTKRFAGGWSLDAALGVSLTRRELLTGKDNSTALTGQLKLCKDNERTTMCFGGSRASEASGFGGVRVDTSVYGSYSYRLTERSTLAGRVSYSKNDAGGLPISGDRDYFSTTVDYSHQLGEKLRLTAGAAYRDAYGRGLSPDADISGRIGLAYTLGDRR
ncbi:hypothetical protein SAMN06295912_11874 [Sphingomonas laterariae]|uniref:Beta-barrel porin 2 n=1 Tax=Edaphosphingomonas laterariae TaxID=861865 RepID=A0A239HQX6_9SPHN|nr:hypothetical protein [Sphingomonas laterariae]SNS83722.1 hypothetical protein SAMN06295912_11874 [Sphingomonas laterariae]